MNTLLVFVALALGGLSAIALVLGFFIIAAHLLQGREP